MNEIPAFRFTPAGMTDKKVIYESPYPLTLLFVKMWENFSLLRLRKFNKKSNKNNITDRLMAKKRIVTIPDAVLREKAKPVTVFHSKLGRLIDNMIDILYADDGRAGLAAPQIGVSKRISVMDCGDGLIELINPEILERSGSQTGTEGCLSIPGYYGTVERADYVKVKTFDRKGNELLLEAEGFNARCMQHEVDHLDGILYIDHVVEDEYYCDKTNEKADLEAARIPD